MGPKYQTSRFGREKCRSAECWRLHIAKKLQMKLCASCRSTITGSLSGSNNELLLVNKQFSNCKGKGLEIPGFQLVTAVQVLEKSYSTNIMQILHADNVKARLVSLLKKEITHAVLVCPLASCEIENHIIDKIAVRHSLKNL